MRVLVAPDKFKGCMTARAVSAALASGLTEAGAAVDECPIADGGEGFAEALAQSWTAVRDVRDPAGRLIVARYGWQDAETAVVEASEASGLHCLAQGERNPWKSSTFGTGQLIADAVRRGARRILVGLGGSATNDGGAGAAAALGWNFLTSDGEPVEPAPENFLALERIEAPEGLDLPRIVAACDVDNPLLGTHGASRIFAPQKGADERMVEHLEMALRHVADLAADEIGTDFRDVPGAGAAGGLGFGLMTFCGAELRSGFQLVAEAVRLEERIAAADLVITGEGTFDAQTLRGKGPAGVARLAKAHGKRVAIVCGQCTRPEGAEELFDRIIPLSAPGRSGEASMRETAKLLHDAGLRFAVWAGQDDNAAPPGARPSSASM